MSVENVRPQKRLLSIKLSYENAIFWPCLGEGHLESPTTKNRYLDRKSFSWINGYPKRGTRKHRKKRSFDIVPMWKPCFFANSLITEFPKPCILQSFRLDLVPMAHARFTDQAANSSETHANNGVLETWIRTNTWKHRILHHGIVKTSFFTAFSCR